MAAAHEVEVWVLVDSDGNAVATADESLLDELYDEQVGGVAGLARRRVRVVLTVPVPEETVLRGTVPAEGEATLTVG
jgi:hypothetical protein